MFIFLLYMGDNMVKRYMPVTKFFPTRKGANTLKKILQGKNPSQKFRVKGNTNKSAFRIEIEREY